MKRLLVLCIVAGFFSVQSWGQRELNEKQKEVIREEVGAALDKHLKSLRTLDYDLWLECISKDYLVPGFFPGVVGSYPDYDRFVGEIKHSFQVRERQQYESLQKNITPLSADLAMATFTAFYENWFKSGAYRADYINTTLLYKKEKAGWKIIYLNENWIPKTD